MANRFRRLVQPPAGQTLIRPANPVKLTDMQPMRLTPRQGEVLALLLEGRTNKEIARVLEISPFTARAHVAAVMQHYGATRRQELPELCSPGSRNQMKIAGDALPSPAVRHPLIGGRWIVGVSASAGLILALFIVEARGAGHASAWSAAKLTPEVLILKSVGTPNTEIRIDTIATPQMDSRDDFLRFSRKHLKAAMAQQHLGRHRFEPLRIDDVSCLAYAGVSPPAQAGDGFTHAKGYFCQHPRRTRTAIRIGAIASGRASDFADGKAVRVVLRELLEDAATAR